MEKELEKCPLFTELHSQHSVVWSVPGFSLPTLCVACVIERLGKKGELRLHTRKVLSEIQALLTEGTKAKLLAVLKSDKRVLERLCGHLFSLLASQDFEQAMEVLMTIMNLAEDSDVELKLLHTAIHTVMTSQSFPSSLPHLTFLGKLLHSNPALSNTVAKSYSNFLEFILGGLTYPDDSVKSSVVYVLVQVCSKSQPNSMALPLVQNMCQYVSTNLATAKSQELTVNLLGLVRHLLRSGTYTQCLIQADKLDSGAKGSTFASAFKRVLLSRDELLQLSAVQCVAEVLCHHMDYGKVLLTADIAEFLFEALSSKNELLIGCLFSCLNSLATLDDFYTNCHVLYGIEAVLNGLSASMRMRAYTAAQIGFNLLINIMEKQPKGMQLFTTHSDLKRVLKVILVALEVKLPALVLQATSLLKSILCSHHLPHGLPVSIFFPALAMLLYLIEPMTTPTQIDVGGSATDQRQLQEVLATFSKAYRYVEEIASSLKVDNKPTTNAEDITFFFQAYEQSLLPAVLLNMDSLDNPDPFASLFSMANCHLSLSSVPTAHLFAEKLAGGAFINLVFEVKARFLTAEGYNELSSSGNELLASLCFHLEKKSMERAIFVKDTLQVALPSMNCGIEGCLHYLCQKAPSVLYHDHVTGGLGHMMTAGSQSIVVLQQATLLLLQCAFSHGDILVPPDDVLKALHKYLSLNPSIHLLPSTILQCLATLFAETLRYASSPQTEWVVVATQVLAHGLLKVCDPSQLCCCGNSTLLQWAFSQPPLLSTVAKSWLLQWLQSSTLDMSKFVTVLEKSLPSLHCLLGLLTEDGDSTIPLEVVLRILERLVSKECDLKIRTRVIQSLQDALTKQRVDPIPEPSLVVILKLMTSALEVVESINVINLKLVFKATSIVCRAEVGGSGCVAQHGMNLICKILTTHAGDIQIATLLLNNSPFLHKVGSFLSESTSPKAHSAVSASAFHLIALLSSSQTNLSIKVTQCSDSVRIKMASAITALLSPLAPAQIAGLELWRVIFSREGQTGFLELVGDNPDDCTLSKLPRKVFFLVLNCFLSDDGSVRAAAATCGVEVIKYIMHCQGGLTEGRHWVNTLMHYLVETYHSTSLPLLYIPILTSMLSLMTDNYECPYLSSLSQLLYKAYLNIPSDLPGKEVHAGDFKVCFDKISHLNSEALSAHQWSIINSHGVM